MSLLTLEAKLQRQDSTTPWGFRMQGGTDFSSPITIARVSPGSLAARCGLLQGDVIHKIGNKFSEKLTHKDAQDAIIQYGNKLDLLLQRYDHHHHGGGVPSHDKFSTPSITTYYRQAGSQPNVGSQNYNKTPKPFGSTANKPSPTPHSPTVDNVSLQTKNIRINSGGVGRGDGGFPSGGAGGHGGGFGSRGPQSPQTPKQAVPNVVHAQYNSPMGLYSASNIADSYSAQTAGIRRQMSDAPDSEYVPDYSKYVDTEEPAGPQSHQSNSFKILQNTLDRGEEPSNAPGSAPWKSS